MKAAILFSIIVALSSTVHGNHPPVRAVAFLNQSEVVSGTVTFTQLRCQLSSVLVTVEISGLTPGKHGFHVHEKGDLSDGCTSTGSHYNPDEVSHGGPEDHTRHVGDLGNVVADESGKVTISFYNNKITLFGTRSIIGRSIVVHATEDDLGRGGEADSLTNGHVGARIACGVIRRLNIVNQVTTITA